MADNPSIKINTTTYSSIRSALTAAASGSTIILSAGSFNITKSDNDLATPGKPGSSPATLARSTVSNLTVRGAGPQSTTISGNARLFARGVDGSIAPTGMRVEDLLLIYASASGYIFSPSRGSLPYNPGAPTISNYSLRNVSFSGRHLGAVGANGTYMDITGSNAVTFDAIKVTLSGQSGYDPLLGTGGGFFIFNEGGRNLLILNSEFDESGYSSSIFCFASPDVRVDANRFLGADLIKQDDGNDPADNPRGERFYNSGGLFTNNYLSSGAFFDYFFNVSNDGAVWQDYKFKNPSPDGTFGLRTVVSGNIFDLLTGGYGLLIRSDSDASVVQKTLTVSGNTFSNGLAVRNELSTPGELVFGSNTVNGTLFTSLHVGGLKDDQLNKSPVVGSTSNWLSGGLGNDQLDGSTDAFDAFVFWAPLDSHSNVDTIRGFETASGTPDQIWLDVSRFASLYSTNGLLDANSFASNLMGLATATRSQIIYNLSSGSLFYDPDGTGAAQGIAFAILEEKPALSAGNIFLFGSPQSPPPPPPALPLISLAQTPASVAENGIPNLTYTFTRSGSTTNPLTVNYTISGSAINGGDYGMIPASVTFAAGSDMATVTVDPTADSVLEQDETVSLTLSADPTYTIGTPVAVTGTIANDDAASFSISDVSIVEGNAGTSMAAFFVTLSNAVAGGASVNVVTANNTAAGGSDYVATSGSLNFAGNAGESQTVSVTINGDTTFEQDETFFLNLSAPTNGVTLADGQGAGTITNDDYPPQPVITLAVSPSSVVENGSSNLIYTFTRSGSTSNPLTASYTVGGTATLSSDYAGIPTTGSIKTVPFAAGSATATVIVNPTGDLTVETNETVSLTVASGSGYTIATADPITGVILNDDAQITGTTGSNTFTFSKNRNTYTGLEGSDAFRLTRLTQSLFSAYDFITDFAVGRDIIDAPLTQPTTAQIISAQPTALTSSAIAQLLNTTGNFRANGASVFSFGSSDARRTFLVINNSNAAFSASTDTIIEITGYTGDLTQLQVI